MVSQTGPIYWQKRLKLLLPGLWGLGMVVLWGKPVWSHGAIATVTQTYTVEATYASGEPMARAQVVVYSPENPEQPWLTGQTDAQGSFDFQPDNIGSWEVVIRQAGHGTVVNVPVETAKATAQIQTERPSNTDRSDTEQNPSAQNPERSDQRAQVISTAASTPLQRWASAGAGLWGLVGTALFFSRGNSRGNQAS